MSEVSISFFLNKFGFFYIFNKFQIEINFISVKSFIVQ